jgi:hypothetical protein
MSSGGDNPDDSKGKSKAVPTGRVQRFAKVAKLAGGMLAEGTRAIRAGKRPSAKELLLAPANAKRGYYQLN